MGKRIEINAIAPDFELHDFSGRSVRLSDYRDRRHVVLVFNRGFA
jgi:peroxiredoxin